MEINIFVLTLVVFIDFGVGKIVQVVFQMADFLLFVTFN